MELEKREFTLRAVLCGIFAGVILSALLIYLYSFAGMDINASPIGCLMGIVLLPLFGGKAGKRELNIMQTTASAVTLSAAGLATNYVAAMVLGLEFDWASVLISLVLANLTGVFFIAIVKAPFLEDPSLAFPQATMCISALNQADHLKGKDGRRFFLAIGAGFLITFLQNLGVVPKELSLTALLPGGMVFGVLLMPMLIGTGYILGFKVCLILFAGSLCSNLILAPLGTRMGWYVSPALDYSAMQNFNVPLIIGMSLFAFLLPLFRQRGVFRAALRFRAASGEEQDLKMGPLWIGFAVSLTALILYYWLRFDIHPILMLFFLFIGLVLSLITIRIAAETGLGAALAFNIFHLLVVYTILRDAVLALLVCFVSFCITTLASNTITDLKTGRAFGATPKKQIWAQLVGILPGVLVGTLFFYALVTAYGLNAPEMSFPVGKMYSSVVAGLSSDHALSAMFDWGRFGLGGVIGVLFSLVGLPAGAIAISLYLLPSIVSGIMIGGLIQGILKKAKGAEFAARHVNTATGLVIGDAVVSIIMVILSLLR